MAFQADAWTVVGTAGPVITLGLVAHVRTVKTGPGVMAVQVVIAYLLLVIRFLDRGSEGLTAMTQRRRFWL